MSPTLSMSSHDFCIPACTQACLSVWCVSQNGEVNDHCANSSGFVAMLSFLCQLACRIKQSLLLVKHLMLLRCAQGVTYTHRTSYMYAMLKCAPDNMCLSCNSCIYAMVPMYHATAWGVPFCAPMVGARLVLPGQLASVPGIHISFMPDAQPAVCQTAVHACCSACSLPHKCMFYFPM